MFGLGIAIFCLFLLAFWRHRHHELRSLEFKYKLYQLRDQLRVLAIEEKLDFDQWIFKHYDRSFSKTIGQHYYLTFYFLFMLVFKYGNDKELVKLNTRVERETKKVPELERLRKEYLKAVKQYMQEQHYVSVNFILKPIIIPVLGTAVAARRFNDWVNNVLVFPKLLILPERQAKFLLSGPFRKSHDLKPARVLREAHSQGRMKEVE